MTPELDSILDIVAPIARAMPSPSSARGRLQLPRWMNAVSFGLMVVRPDGVIEGVNRVAAQLMGYDPLELAGSGIERLVPGHMVSRHKAMREAWSGERSSVSMSRLRTVEGRRKDGSVIALHIELARPWDESPGTTLVTLRDMRPLLALEAQLHRLQRMENLGLIAAGAVHDFNNHLNTLELLCSLQEGQDEEWADVRATTHQLRQLVDSLHRISRAELEPIRDIDLVQLVADHRGIFDRVTDGTLTLVVPSTRVRVRGRLTELVQCIVNLLLNALHAHREAGVRDRITLTIAAQVHQRVEVSVSDRGVGMTGEQVARACEPGVTSRGHRGGSGLGLAIVRSVVDTHGGRFELHSRPGHGTTATMLLPVLAPAAAVG